MAIDELAPDYTTTDECDRLYDELVEVSGGDDAFVTEWLISLITADQLRDCIAQVKERMAD